MIALPTNRQDANSQLLRAVPALLVCIALGVAAGVWSRDLVLPTIAVSGLVWLAWSLPALGLKALVLRAEWWQLLWVGTLASGFVFRSRTIDDASSNPLDSAALMRVGLMGLVAVGLQFAIIGKRISVVSPMFRGLFLLMTLFNVVNLASYLWSVNPPWTLYRALEHTVDVTLIVTIAAVVRDTAGYRRLFNWTWLLMAGMLGSVAFGVVLAPDQAVLHDLGVLGISVEGIYPLISRNAIGGLGALVAIVGMARLATSAGSTRLYWGVVLIGVSVVIISQTRSALAPLALSMPVVLLASRRFSWGLAVVALVAAAMLMTGLSDTLTSYWQRNETSGQIHQLNGRLAFWQYSLDLAEERPLTGYGAYAGGRFEVAKHAGLDTLSSAHGTFTEVLVGTGYPGLALLILMVLGTTYYIGKSAVFGARVTENERATWALSVEALGVLTLLVIRSIFDVELIWHPSLVFLALFAYAEYLRRNDVQTKTGSKVSQRANGRQPVFGPGDLGSRVRSETYSNTQRSTSRV